MKNKAFVVTRVRILGIAVFLAACAAAFMLGRVAQASKQASLKPGGDMRLILDEQQLGSKAVSLGERTYPAGYQSSEHSHSSIEVIYVLSGEYRHIVNGQTQVLGPGMVGFVKPGDKVRHTTGPGSPATTLMIWVPGDEGRSIFERFQQRTGAR